MSKHRGSTSKTFIVVDFIDDEVGQWATDEVIGEEGYVVDEGPCFWTWNNNKYAWIPRPFWSRKLKRNRRRKGNRLAHKAEEHSLVKSKHRNQKCGLKKVVLGGSKVNEERKALRRAIKVFIKVDFAQAHLKKKGSRSF